ncbi:MAG: hypothetical protein WCB58_08505, partial [Acidobacteriaceae bacterium]
RHDFAKNLLYGLVSLPIAWHPLVWRTRARVAESRELVCDAMAADAIAAEAVGGRKHYAQSLLRLASMLSAGPRVAPLHALGILSLNTDARIFERRIMTLTHKRVPMSATAASSAPPHVASSPSPPAPQHSHCIPTYPH